MFAFKTWHDIRRELKNKPPLSLKWLIISVIVIGLLVAALMNLYFEYKRLLVLVIGVGFGVWGTYFFIHAIRGYGARLLPPPHRIPVLVTPEKANKHDRFWIWIWIVTSFFGCLAILSTFFKL